MHYVLNVSYKILEFGLKFSLSLDYFRQTIKNLYSLLEESLRDKCFNILSIVKYQSSIYDCKSKFH